MFNVCFTICQIEHCWIFVVFKRINSVPHGMILDWSKLKEFAEDKIYVTEKLKYALGRVENITGKGENAGYQHFLLFP